MPLIGMSFEGVGNAVENRRRFMSENMKAMRQLFIASVNRAGTTPVYARQAYGIPKGYAAIVPNRYIISKGSLVTPSQFLITPGVSGQGISRYQYFQNVVNSDNEPTLFAGSAVTASQVIRGLFGCEPGDQMTFVAIITQNGEGYVYNGIEEIGYMTRFGEMISRRVVFKDPGVTFDMDEGSSAFTDFIASCIDDDKTDSWLKELIVNGVGLTPATGTAINAVLTDVQASDILGEKRDEYTIRAACWFQSRLDSLARTWRYSNSQLVLAMQPYETVDEANEALWYGVPYGVAVETYMKGQSSASSDLYTQTGGDDDNLGF